MCVDCAGGFWASFCFRLVTLQSEANMKMWLFVYLYVEPVSRSKDYVRSWIKHRKTGSVLCLCTPVSPSVPERGASFFEDVPVVEFMYLIFTRVPGESYRGRLRYLLLCLCYVFRALINFLVRWFTYSGVSALKTYYSLVFGEIPVLCMCTVWSVIQMKKHTLCNGEIRYAVCRISYVAETVLVFPPFKQLAVFNQRHGVVGSVQPFVVVGTSDEAGQWRMVDQQGCS